MVSLHISIAFSTKSVKNGESEWNNNAFDRRRHVVQSIFHVKGARVVFSAVCTTELSSVVNDNGVDYLRISMNENHFDQIDLNCAHSMLFADSQRKCQRQWFRI